MSSDNTSVIFEYFDTKFAVLIENIDSKITAHMSPLEATVLGVDKRLSTVEKVIMATNKDIQALDKATGNMEYKLRDLHTLVTSNYLNDFRQDREVLRQLEVRLNKLEATA